MCDIELLKKCGESFPFYKPFLDKCIDELNNNTDNLETIKQFIDMLSKMVEDNGEFFGSTPEIILAYSRKLRL